MSNDRLDPTAPRIQEALRRLRSRIEQRYPSATFEVLPGEDPAGIYLRVIVDIEDADEVMDAVIDRLYEIQVKQGLPVYVVPVEPLERAVAVLNAGSPWKAEDGR